MAIQEYGTLILVYIEAHTVLHELPCILQGHGSVVRTSIGTITHSRHVLNTALLSPTWMVAHTAT